MNFVEVVALISLVIALIGPVIAWYATSRVMQWRVGRTESDIKELRQWKHVVVDPYVPRAIDEHERRINKLDAKIFNGGPK